MLCLAAAVYIEHRSRLRGRAALLLGASFIPALLAFAVPQAYANPAGGNVVAGQALIGGAGRTLTVDQTSSRAIINWQSFSIGAGQTTRFNLPSANAAILNRVTGTQLSSLLGNLYSNGQVYLLNPNGIVVGPNGRVETKGFIASTLDTQNKQFMAGGQQTLKGDSTAGVTVLGTVKVNGGDVLLVAAQVNNQGKIIAPDGKAILAAGSEVLYVPGAGANIVIAAPAPATGAAAAVNNDGVIKAASVQLAAAGSAYALAINNGGQISATGVRNVGGHIVLEGGEGDVVNTGALTASAGDVGGSVTIQGGRVALTGNAIVDVTGASGGGKVSIAASDPISVTPGTKIAANATVKGDGGAIKVKSDKATDFAGTASVAGGPQGGDGGQAEISGASLSFSGIVDRSAPLGKAGSLLFDPTDITIVSGNAAAPPSIAGGLWAFAQDTVSGQTISVGAIETLLNGGNLELQASNSLTVAAPVGGAFSTIDSATTNTLTLTAPTIAVNASISLSNGALVFNWSDAAATAFSTSANTVASALSATITAQTLRVAGNYSTVSLGGPVTTSSLQFTRPDFSTGITINNAANAITAASFDPTGNNHANSFDVESASALTVSGSIVGGTTATLVAGGDLTLQSGFALNGVQKVVLASTGGVINNLAGSGAASVLNGRILLYSATNGMGASGVTFNDGGIGSGAPVFQTFSGVSFPNDPNTSNSVVEYFVATSAQPVLTITADSFTRTYNRPDPAFTASYSGGSGGGASELTTMPTFRIVQGSDVNAGTYTIEPYGAASSTDLLHYVDGTLTVNPAVLTIAANSASMTYGGTVPTFGANITGFLGGDTAALVSGLLLTSNAGAAPSAGSYPITPSAATVATPPGGTQPNYTIMYQTDTLTVNPASLTVTAHAYNAVYGATIATPQLTFSGFVNAGDAASVPNQFAPVTGTTAGSGVGTYPITLLSANPNSNYTTTYVGANLTITPAPLTITPNATKVYGAALPTTLPALDFAGLVAGDTPARFTTQPTLNTSGVNVGSYSITASGAVDPNYTISYAPGTLAITPASLTITANDAAHNYGGANPGFTASYSGLVNGDTASTLSGLTFATAATSASNVGVYQILPSGAVDPNYTISYAPATLTINPAPLQITPSGGSIYGQSPATTASVTYNAVGFANGDTLASLTTQPSFATPAISTTNVGFYALFASGASDPNYTISYQPGTLAVNRATVTLSVNASSSYGSPIGKVPVIAAGLVNGDTLATVFGSSPIASTTATSRSNVGTYSASIFAGPVIDTNYAVSLGSGAYRITPAPLLITANDQTYSYGTTNPAFGVSYSGLVNGDTSSVVSGLTVSSTAIIGGNIGSPPTLISNVGTYQTTAFGGSASNYAITYAPGTLRITRAPLSITPSGASVYGQDPNRTAIVSYDIAGLVNGDTLASLTTQPTFSTTATGGSGAGTYFLSASGASDPNYSITYFRGQLQINPATLTLTPASATSTTGSPIPAIAIIAEGLVNGDTLANIFASPPTVATGATSASQPGSYITTISAGPVTDKNYVAKLGKGTLAIKIVPDLPNTTFVDPGSTKISPVQPPITKITPFPVLVILPPKVDVITISPLFIAPETYGKALGSFGPAAGDVINMFLATMTDSKPPVTVGAVVAALKNPDTKISTAMMGLLLPFLYDYLGDILKISESAWTPNQVMFVKQFETYVQAQRRAAALQAESDYEAWAKAAVAEEQKKIDRVSGTAQIYEMAILSANPPVPPADFLNQVQAGFILTGNQTVTMAGLNAQVSAFGDAITGAQGISEFAELARAGIQLSGNGANTKTLVAKMPSLGKTILPNAKKGLSLLNEKVSSAKKALATAKDTGEDVSKAASRLQQAEDAAKIVVTAGDVVASVGVVLEVVGNAVQIGMAAAAYAQAADYNTAFQKAVNAANQPVTASDLKAMMSNSAGQQQIFNYLSTQLATAGQPPAPTQSYMTLSAILKITQSF